MTTIILDATTRAAVRDATSQQAQLEALIAPWSAGQVTLRYYSAADALLVTCTHAAWAINTSTTPRQVAVGALVSESGRVAGPTAASYVIAAVPGGADILRADVTLAASVGTSTGRPNLAPQTGGAGLVVTADAGLPAAPMPAWRSAMIAEDTLYYVGTSTPESAPALAGLPSQFGSGGAGFFGAGWDVISGYASGTLIADDGGSFGKMVYGCGGHTRLQNQILGIDLNADDPTYSWWHQPTWETADANGANFYWSPTESAALQAGVRGAAAYINPDNETATTATWDRAFPVAFGNWIFPRQMTTGQMGSSVPHGFRYKTTGYIPASVTGSDPLYLAVMGPQGPFGQYYTPDGSNDSEWFDSSVLVSGARRWPYYFRNVRTGAWALHQWQPAGTVRGGYSSTPVCTFSDIKRAYVIATVTGANYWYLDFTAGYAGHTVVVPGTSARLDLAPYAGVAWSEGDVYGRHFAVGLARTLTDETKLVVIDFDAGTSYHIDLAAQGFVAWPEEEFQNFTFDAANQRVLFLRRNTSTYRLEYWSITVPAVLTNAAGWICSAKRTPALGDAGMSSTHFGGSDRMAHLYGKSDFLPRLGVCLVPFNQNRMLAFRPSV